MSNKSYNDILNLNVSKRSDFYSIEPIGIGTPYVESLTSYITRLANIHNVLTKDLIKETQKYFWDIGYEDFTRLPTGFYERSSAINGVGKWNSNFTKSLKKMTLYDDLKGLSFIMWEKVLPAQNLVRRVKAYCPLCYKAFQDRETQVYDMLIWTLRCIDICPIHNCKLLISCPYEDCNVSFQFLNPKELLGYCPKCNRWLGKEEFLQKNDSKINIEEYNYIIEQIKGLILMASNIVKKPDDSNIYLGLNKIKKVFGEDSYTELANYLDIPLPTIRNWIYAKSKKPNLISLLMICNKTKLSLVDLLNEGILKSFNYDDVNLNIEPLRYNKKGKISTNDKEILNTLRQSIESKQDTPSSLAEISRKLDLSVTVIRNRFPMLSKEVANNRLRYLNDQKIRRIHDKCNLIREAVIELNKRGEYPSQQKVRKYIDYQHVFFVEGARETWRRTLNELGYKSIEDNK